MSFDFFKSNIEAVCAELKDSDGQQYPLHTLCFSIHKGNSNPCFFSLNKMEDNGEVNDAL